MRRIVRALTPLLSVALLCMAPSHADAQLSWGLQAAHANDVFGGSNGLGAVVGVGVPLFPVNGRVGGEYFFPDCGSADGCSFMGWSAAVNVAIPFPVVRPYATGALVQRRFDPGNGADATTDTGFAGGIGLEINPLLMTIFAEVRYEWVDPDNQFVLRVGFLR
jgi:hypothetical protein